MHYNGPQTAGIQQFRLNNPPQKPARPPVHSTGVACAIRNNCRFGGWIGEPISFRIRTARVAPAGTVSGTVPYRSIGARYVTPLIVPSPLVCRCDSEIVGLSSYSPSPTSLGRIAICISDPPPIVSATIARFPGSTTTIGRRMNANPGAVRSRRLASASRSSVSDRATSTSLASLVKNDCSQRASVEFSNRSPSTATMSRCTATASPDAAGSRSACCDAHPPRHAATQEITAAHSPTRTKSPIIPCMKRSFILLFGDLYPALPAPIPTRPLPA